MFEDLKGLPQSVAESTFRLFDINGNAQINFRNFCIAMSICCMSSREQKLKFIFDMFDTDDDGFLVEGDLDIMLN